MSDEISCLKELLSERDKEIENLKCLLNRSETESSNYSNSHKERVLDLSQKEIKKYSRQLILPEIGVDGQIALKRSSVLIVGAGGLGCPVGMYLAAAGVGKLGIVDYDVVDESNLHRQIAHHEESIGQDKCLSFVDSINKLNSSVECISYPILLNSSNIVEIIKHYDIIVDASDNVPTRYLLNDAAVLFKKPLVSGSALKFEGQLTVYNFSDGPCYRCLFPCPPSSENIANCSDAGVLGAITGFIGSLQALEVIKLIVGLQPSYFKKMLVFDGISGDVRVFKLRRKKQSCELCGNNPTIKELIDYELFCNAKANDKELNLSLLDKSERIPCTEYNKILSSGVDHILIDVRPEIETRICCLPHSYNIPLKKLSDENSLKFIKSLISQKNSSKNYVVCRKGNDSQKAVNILKKCCGNCTWYDIIGGLYAWHDKIDPSLPLY